MAAIVALAAILRLANIDQESLWADEGLTVVLGHWPIKTMLWYPVDETPVLYYALHQWTVAAGAGAGAVRLVSACVGIASVVAMYALGRLAIGRIQGLICAALLAVWPFHVDYSQEARAYSLLFFLTTTSAATLLWWFWETQAERAGNRSARRRIALAAFAASTTLCFYTHLLAVIWIALTLQILVSFTARTRTKRHLVEAGLAIGAMAIFAIPGVVRLFRKIGVPDAFHWLPQASPRTFLTTLFDVTLPFGSTEDWPTAVVALILASALILGALCFLVARRRLQATGEWAESLRTKGPAIAVTIALLSLPLFLWLFGFVVRPVFMPRTILFAIPGVILLVVSAITLIRNRTIFCLTSTLFLFAYVAATLHFGTVRPKEKWGAATEFLAANVRHGDLVIVCPTWKYPAARHALSALPLDAPALTWSKGRMLLMEQRFGAEPDWAKKYFGSVILLNQQVYQSDDEVIFRPTSISAARGSSVWLIDSECEASTTKRIDDWIGSPPAWNRVWRKDGQSFRDRITINRYVLANPLRRPVELVQEVEPAA
ncbi:glycosyltransferase family 39 protein [Sphingomonas sp. LY160]|uniref:glycosyltransferase family 39 protein n=1 Tax=Sphingomonas sp. LY160 TaxID=3095342 RepID=UPI002ADEF245|nr:glycosyltransferase family 39 protein [Sphingomonas sp. LY160]MEA1072986.1 glycosyltransferase family 39 protein [Sphingomonas sp. LY160]